MFTAALLTIVKIWKPPKCLSTDKCTKKIWCVHDTENYSTIKKNEIMLFAATWMDLEIIIYVKSEKDKYDIIYMWNLKK